MSLGTYNGGKQGNGVYQNIINHIPPHNVYVAPFAGHDGVFQKSGELTSPFLTIRTRVLLKNGKPLTAC